jgi:hypothetical protein
MKKGGWKTSGSGGGSNVHGHGATRLWNSVHSDDRQRTFGQSSPSAMLTVAPSPCEPPHVAGKPFHPPLPERGKTRKLGRNIIYSPAGSRMIHKCGLCLKTAELKNSHLMPAAIYRLLREPARTNSNPVVIRPEASAITSKQVYSHFLCDECEQRFSDGGERCVTAHCARQNGVFKLRARLEAATPISISSTPPFKVYDAELLLGKMTESYLYFSASIFWRASAHQWEFNGEPVARIRLGDRYQEQFRVYLLGQAPFPPNARLYLHVSSEPNPDMTCVFPCTSRVDGLHRHKFSIPGLAFILFVGSGAEKRHNDTALNGTTNHYIWLCPFQSDSLFRGINNVMRTTKAKGSLGLTTK